MSVSVMLMEERREAEELLVAAAVAGVGPIYCVLCVVGFVFVCFL